MATFVYWSHSVRWRCCRLRSFAVPGTDNVANLCLSNVYWTLLIYFYRFYLFPRLMQWRSIDQSSTTWSEWVHYQLLIVNQYKFQIIFLVILTCDWWESQGSSSILLRLHVGNVGHRNKWSEIMAGSILFKLTRGGSRSLLAVYFFVLNMLGDPMGPNIGAMGMVYPLICG